MCSKLRISDTVFDCRCTFERRVRLPLYFVNGAWSNNRNERRRVNRILRIPHGARTLSTEKAHIFVRISDEAGPLTILEK